MTERLSTLNPERPRCTRAKLWKEERTAQEVLYSLLWSAWPIHSLRVLFMKHRPVETSPVAQTVKNPPAMWETWVWSLGWEDLLEKEMEAHSSILAWRIPMDRGAWWATVHGVTKSQTQLSSRHGMACFIFVWIKLERINFTAFGILQKGIFNILRASCGYTDSWDITVRKNYIMSLACEWQRENCFLLQREKS